MKGDRILYNKLLSKGKKKCSSCKEVKELHNFYFKKNYNSYQSKCNDCMVLYRRKLKPLKEQYKQRLDLHEQKLKKCSRCEIVKPYSEYGINKSTFYGIQCYCKSCKSERQKEYRENPRFKEKLLDKKKEYYHRVKNSDKYLNYLNKRKEKRDYKKERASVLGNEFRRIKESLRKSTNSVFARYNREWIKKDTKTEILLGANFFEVKEFIERQFLAGMSWDNYGKDWHIDHVIPLDSANKDVEKLKRLCYYQNLSPVWWKDNLEKGYVVPDICTLWENPIVPYKEKDIVIIPKHNGFVGRYKLQIENGTRYGMLEVIGEGKTKKLKCGVERRMLTCKCDCGVIKDMYLNSLRSNKAISCGCLQRKNSSEFNSKNKKTNYNNEELKEIIEYVNKTRKGISPPDEMVSKYKGRTREQLMTTIRSIRNGTLRRINYL